MSRRVTIIITNYNYARFVGQAIESAIAVRCADKEIIVCDDGSEDGSRAVIERYRNRVDTIIYKENGGQPSAANRAFEAATGEIVFFLDSDDLYLPEIAERVLAVWRDGVSKVQFPMLNADGAAKPNGTMFPNFRGEYPPERVRRELIETGLYASSPTTGNAYSRAFLRNVFPMPENMTIGFDGFTNVTAPLFGDVVTLTDPLAVYRIHGKNSWALADFDPKRLAYYIQEDFLRTEYLRRFAKKLDVAIPMDVLNNNWFHLMCRLGCLRAAPEVYPLANENRFIVLQYALRATLTHGGSRAAKMMLLVWFLTVTVSPRPVALYLLRLRFVASDRPKIFLTVMRFLGILREKQTVTLSNG